jgi:integrase
MATRKALTKSLVEAAKPTKFGAMAWDGRVPGFGCRVFPGKRQYIYRYRAPDGRQRTVNLGIHGALTVEQARQRALDIYEQVRKGRDPVADEQAARAELHAQDAVALNRRTVADVLDQFMSRKGEALRSADEYRRVFDKLVNPAIGTVDIHTLRRSQIADMLDHIEDRNGPVMADRTLAYTRSAFNWYGSRDDEFNSPIAKRMARTRPRERARTRVLADDELRLLWGVLDGQGTFGAFVRLLLLTAQRRGEVAGMRRAEICDGIWTIPAARYKTGHANTVPLSEAALTVIEAQPGRDQVFMRSSLAHSGTFKAALDKAVTAANAGEVLPNWTIHDLRRTAKTLMARAGVRPDISERVLGHVIAGVEGVYDQHTYLEERRDALERLAAMVERIVSPPPESVVVELVRARR